MISVSFINDEHERLLASDPFLSLERAMTQMSEEIDNAITAYLNTSNQYMIESEIMGELDEEKSVYLESEKSNIFDKIGNAVIEIFKKFQELIKKVIDKIKNIGFKNKSNEEKMKSLLEHYKKNDPEKYRTIKDDVVVAYKSGELDPIDMKSIKEMNDAYDEIVRLAKQKDVKPDTLRDKIEEMKRKYDKALEKGTISKTAKNATVIITAIIAIATFRSKINDSRKNTLEYEKKLSEKNEATIKAIKELEKFEGGKFASDSLTKAQLLKNANYWITGQYGKLISKEEGKIEKLNNGITSWIARHEKSKKDKFMSGVNNGASIISDKEKKAREEERRKNQEDAFDKAKGQTKAQDDALLGTDSKHRKAIKKETEIKTKQQQRTQRYLNDDAVLHNGNHRDAIRDQAKIQAAGRDAGTPQRKPGTQKIAIVDAKGNNINPGKTK